MEAATVYPKYAQYGLTKVLREELKETGVRVTAVLPGATRTGSWDGTDLPDSRFLKTRDNRRFNRAQLPNCLLKLL